MSFTPKDGDYSTLPTMTSRSTLLVVTSTQLSYWCSAASVLYVPSRSHRRNLAVWPEDAIQFTKRNGLILTFPICAELKCRQAKMSITIYPASRSLLSLSC
jgi:hypothetical protein